MVNYFAYGSNMLRERLLARVGSVQELGVARLDNHSLTFDKRGGDGSGKCTVIPRQEGGCAVWGVVFGLTFRQRSILDEYEGAGYETRHIRLSREHERVEAFTYIARAQYREPTGSPFPWYRDLVLAGALQCGLPRTYVEAIEAIETITDPDRGREEENHQLIIESGFGKLLSRPNFGAS